MPPKLTQILEVIPEPVSVIDQAPVQPPVSEAVSVEAAAAMHDTQVGETPLQDAPVRQYKDREPASLRVVLGTNAVGATVEAARVVDPRDTRIFLRRSGRNQANMINTSHLPARAVYTGHLITREEVDFRRAHGSM